MKIRITRVDEDKFHLTIIAKKKILIRIINWCNVKTIKVKKRQKPKFISKKPVIYLIIIVNKKSFLKFKNTWIQK